MHKWTTAIITAFVLMTIVSGILEFTYLGVSEQGTIQNLLVSITRLNWSNVLLFPFSAFAALIYVIRILIAALLWDYSFFTDAWQIVRYAVFMPISIGFIVALFIELRGN